MDCRVGISESRSLFRESKRSIISRCVMVLLSVNGLNGFEVRGQDLRDGLRIAQQFGQAGGLDHVEGPFGQVGVEFAPVHSETDPILKYGEDLHDFLLVR